MEDQALAQEYEQEAEKVKERLDAIRKTMTKTEWERACCGGRVFQLRTIYLELRCTARTLRENMAAG